MDADDIQSLSPLQLLRHLHAERFTAAEIADRLNDPYLHVWHKMTVAARAVAPPPSDTWTPRKVRYWIAKLRLPRVSGYRGEYASLNEARAFHRSLRLARWQHLLDRLDLRPREADALDALLEHGPLARPELFRLARWPKRGVSGGVSYLGRLVGAGLVVVTGMTSRDGRLVNRYALADGVMPYQGSGHMTAVDARYRSQEERVKDRYRCILSHIGVTCMGGEG